MNDKLLSTLGLCRKAGKLVWGFDATAQAVAGGKAKLVLLARDLSPKSAKEIRFLCEKHKMKAVDIPVSMDEIWYRLGKRAGILAVTDQGLAHTLESAAGRTNEEE